MREKQNEISHANVSKSVGQHEYLQDEHLGNGVNTSPQPVSSLNNAWVVERPREDDTKSTPAPHLVADTDTKTKNCAAEREAANVLENCRLRHVIYAIWKIGGSRIRDNPRRYFPLDDVL
ncbi:hypothetical protein E2C01_050491 [Portunus trituberculatus]|uniref:Uncharacterized protein n=1 Tax=Portunus trituberculatus TaxID=210409 RepID=A0A5B7GG99_PORTR|nr:hypothetical protein [Portunus trituberculatus]